MYKDNNLTVELARLSTEDIQESFYKNRIRDYMALTMSSVRKEGQNRHFTPASQEWTNSDYTYNKAIAKSYPVADNTVNRLIKSYFNMTPLFNNKKSKRVEVRFKRLSLNRILVSKAEMKHTNDKVIVTVYLYNKNKKVLLHKIKKLYNRFLLKLSNVVNDTTKNKQLKPRTHVTRSKDTLKDLKLKNTRLTNNNYANKTMYNMFVSVKNSNNTKLNNTLNKPLNFSTSAFVNKNTKNQETSYINKKNKSIKNNFLLKTRKTHGKKQIFSTKRYDNMPVAVLISNNIKYINATKKRLQKLFINVKDINLKNKYKTLVKKYYSVLNKYKFYSINENYYLNYLHLPLDSNNLYTSKFYTLLSKNQGNNMFKTKRRNNEIANKAIKGKKSYLNVNFLMYKLRNLSKLFSLNNLYNTNTGKGFIGSNIYMSGILNNMWNILNNPFEKDSKFKSKRIKFINLKGVKIIKRAKKQKNFLFKILKWDNESFSNYEEKYYNNFIKKAYKKEKIYLYYAKLLVFNNNKFKNWFLLGLKRILSKIYNKKVEFNLVSLKYMHLNSDIFSESIAIKLRNRENRLLNVMKKALKLVKLPSINKASFYASKLYNNATPFALNKFKILNSTSFRNSYNNDVLHQLLNLMFAKNYTDNSTQGYYDQDSSKARKDLNKSFIQEDVLDSIKHKNVFGVRLEATGRLSKRLTASRSVFKLKYKGNLKNLDNTKLNLPSLVLRGNLKSNIQYTNINSKTRNGSFGLKGWISGY